MLRVYDNTARYVDQGGGKRKGAFAVYLEPWHADVEAFLDLKKNHGKEEARARHLLYAMLGLGLARTLTLTLTLTRRARATSSTPCGCPTSS